MHVSHTTAQCPVIGRSAKRVTVLLLCTIVGLLQGCLRYLTHNRSEAIVQGVDIERTLIVAEHELQKGGVGSVLTLWALRDQYISPEEARTVNRLYRTYIDSLQSDFNIWHLTWAISDIYRLGSDSVRSVLAVARRDASRRAACLSGLADKFANGEKLYMGDAHIGGRMYARRHLIVPGNKKYLQSVSEYHKRNKP